MGILIEFPLEKQDGSATQNKVSGFEKLANSEKNCPVSSSAQLLFFTGVRYERFKNTEKEKQFV